MARAKWPLLTLQFDPAEILELAKRYQTTGEGDADALAAGKLIRAGNRDRDVLTEIVRWKSKRRVALIKANSKAEVADALEMSLSAKSERAAIAVLTGLDGVAVPMSSAILTAINPKRYTVIDVRALEALGVPDGSRTNPTVSDYLFYLEVCRRQAKALKVSLRNLDRAMWQWSWEL